MEGIERDELGAEKKIRATTREFNSAQFMLRCAELNLSWEMLDHLDMGAVYDMYTEKANDGEKYPYKATQADIYAFFGRH